MPTIVMNSKATAWKGEITWSSTQNTSTNTSTVYASISTWKTDGQPSSSPSGTYFKGVLYVGDEEEEFEFQQQEKNSQWHAEIETTIPHKADGSGSVYIYCEIDAPSGISMYQKPLKGGGTYSLPTIPRESSLSTSGNMYFGSPCSVIWKPASDSFYYKLEFSIGSWSHTTDTISPGTTNSFEYNDYVIPLEQASQFPNSESGTISVSLYSYSDSACSTQVGSASTKSLLIIVPDDIIPEITKCNAAFENSASDIVSSWGIGLVGYSGIKLTASANGVLGSTISSFEIAGSYNASQMAKFENERDKTNAYLEYIGDRFTVSGNKAFTIRCIDSRGRKSIPIEINSIGDNPISVLPYSKPKILSFSTKKEEYGDTNVRNDRMVITAEWEFDPIAGHNYTSCVVYYKESVAKDWFEHPGSVQNNEPFVLRDLELDDKKSYNFKVVVTDAVGGKDDKSSFSSTTQVLLDFRAGGKGLGIGKICEQDGMEVSMNATFYNDIFVQRDSEKYDIETYVRLLSAAVLNESKKSLLNDIYPIGSIYISVSNTNPATLFGGTWERIKDRFLFAAIDESDLNDITDPDDPGRRYLLGKMDGEKEHILTIDEMPRHRHWNAARPDYASPSTHDNGTAGTHPGAVMVSDEDEKNTLPYTDYAGSSLPHNNMPPYLAVYMWKRTG